MAIDLNIGGIFDMTIYNKDTKEEVSIEAEEQVLEQLQSGGYVISFNDKVIYDLDNLEDPIYEFSLEVGDAVEYIFEEQ